MFSGIDVVNKTFKNHLKSIVISRNHEYTHRVSRKHQLFSTHYYLG